MVVRAFDPVVCDECGAAVHPLARGVCTACRRRLCERHFTVQRSRPPRTPLEPEPLCDACFARGRDRA